MPVCAQIKLDNLVGGECLYCGEKMIRSIQRPFIVPSMMDEALKSWQ